MHLPSSINVLIYSTHHENAPHLDAPLVEHNAERQLRPIVLKMRKVRGKTGWLLRRYGHYFGVPKNDPEAVAHRALQVGAYVYELTREEGLLGQRLHGDLIWPSTIGEKVAGWTDMTDEEVQVASLTAQAFVRSRNGGKYDIRHNNCQTFIADLLQRLTNDDLMSDGLPSSWGSSNGSVVAFRSSASSLSDGTDLVAPASVKSSLEIATVAQVVHGKSYVVGREKRSYFKLPQLVVTSTEIRDVARQTRA